MAGGPGRQRQGVVSPVRGRLEPAAWNPRPSIAEGDRPRDTADPRARRLAHHPRRLPPRRRLFPPPGCDRRGPDRRAGRRRGCGALRPGRIDAVDRRAQPDRVRDRVREVRRTPPVRLAISPMATVRAGATGVAPGEKGLAARVGGRRMRARERATASRACRASGFISETIKRQNT